MQDISGKSTPSSAGVGGERVETREPEVVSRDPANVPPLFEVPRMPGVTLVKGRLGKCQRCGCGTFRQWLPDNHSIETGNMERPKVCPWCKKEYVFVEPPTAAELKAIWKARV